jgi:hypothetical protein
MHEPLVYQTRYVEPGRTTTGFLSDGRNAPHRCGRRRFVLCSGQISPWTAFKPSCRRPPSWPARSPSSSTTPPRTRVKLNAADSVAQFAISNPSRRANARMPTGKSVRGPRRSPFRVDHHNNLNLRHAVHREYVTITIRQTLRPKGRELDAYRR